MIFCGLTLARKADGVLIGSECHLLYFSLKYRPAYIHIIEVCVGASPVMVRELGRKPVWTAVEA